MTTLLIKNGHVLDLALPFEATDVFIEDGRIARIGPTTGGADRVIDATGKVVMPGLINAHTHSVQILDRGLGDPYTLDQWSVLGAFGAQAQTSRELYALTAWSALTLLRGGCTASMDITSPAAQLEGNYDAMMQAYVDTGARAAVALALVDLDFYETLPRSLLGADPLPRMPFTRPKAALQLAAARRCLATWKDRSPRVQPYLGPSAPQRLSDELLAGVFALSREMDAGVHTHVLEARSHWFACQERFGASPITHLDRHGWLGPSLSLAHGVWLDEDDMRRIADRGAVLAHNPISNLRLASGIANLQLMLAKGVSVAIGTDGAASNDNQNMWEALKLTAILHRAYGKRASWPTAADALRLCLEGGAAILRQRVGAVRVGHEADLVVLGGRDVFLLPKGQMIASLVLGELGQSVETVVVAGDVVLENGRSTKVDETVLRAEVAAIVEKGVASLPERERGYVERSALIDELIGRVEATAGGPAGLVFPGR